MASVDTLNEVRPVSLTDDPNDLYKTTENVVNPNPRREHPYVIKDGRTYLLTKAGSESARTQLANFIALIKSQRIYVGIDRDAEFVIEATVSNKTIQVILATTDTGNPVLTRYRRVVLEPAAD